MEEWIEAIVEAQRCSEIYRAAMGQSIQSAMKEKALPEWMSTFDKSDVAGRVLRVSRQIEDLIMVRFFPFLLLLLSLLPIVSAFFFAHSFVFICSCFVFPRCLLRILRMWWIFQMGGGAVQFLPGLCRVG